MKRTLSMLAAMASLFFLSASLKADGTVWQRLDPSEARVSLPMLGPAEGVEVGVSRDTGSPFYQEYSWWGFDGGSPRYQVEIGFFYATHRGGWDTTYVGRDAFFEEFAALEENWIEHGATDGPTISTDIGDIETFGFDIGAGADTFGEQHRQCLGFTQGFDRRNTGGWSHFPKVLHFYVCALRGRSMSEEALVEMLAGLGIEDEFEALTEN